MFDGFTLERVDVGGTAVDAFRIETLMNFRGELNGKASVVMWIDPAKQLIRVFLEHRFGFNNESNIFMAMAGAAITDPK